MQNKTCATAVENSASKYWLVVYSLDSGDFNNATMNGNLGDDSESVSQKFEEEHPRHRVIHIGEGELPPKTYRSLAYLN